MQKITNTISLSSGEPPLPVYGPDYASFSREAIYKAFLVPANLLISGPKRFNEDRLQAILKNDNRCNCAPCMEERRLYLDALARLPSRFHACVIRPVDASVCIAKAASTPSDIGYCRDAEVRYEQH